MDYYLLVIMVKITLMKKLLLFIVSCLLAANTSAQGGSRFDFKKTQFGSYLVTPACGQSKVTGNPGQAIWSDKEYMNNLFSGVIREIIPEKDLRKIHLRTGFIVTFNNEGSVLACTFTVDTLDRELITEDYLFNIYNRFKKIKIDMSKVSIGPGTYPTENKVFDYARVFGSFMSVGNIPDKAQE